MAPAQGRRVVFVTGAGGGIGTATATAFADAGFDVVAVDIDAGAARRTADEVRQRGRESLPLQVDLASVEEIREGVSAALDRFGRIDVLVNNAGTGSRDPFDELTPQTWDRVHAVNLRAVFFAMQAVAPQMRERGSGAIVSVSSAAGFRATMTFPVYSSSKAGVDALTRSVAAELGPYGITVNAVAPGLTATTMGNRIGSPEEMAQAVRSGPLANLTYRVASPHDVASVILFLASEGARQITGQTVHTSAGNVV